MFFITCQEMYNVVVTKFLDVSLNLIIHGWGEERTPTTHAV